MRIRNILGLEVIAITIFAVVGLAEVNDVTPSTNDYNKDNGYAYVTRDEVGPGYGIFTFTTPNSWASCFEYRSDGDTSQTIGTNYNTDISDGLYPFTCVYGDTATATVTRNANSYVEIRMVFGAERDERFDWTRFDVIPLPRLSCNYDSGTFLTPFDHSITFSGKKTNRNIPLRFSCVDESGIVVDDVYMASLGWEPPVVNIEFQSFSGSTDLEFSEELLPAGLASAGIPFIYNGEHWILILGLKAYIAPGVYRISAVPGDANYTMDVSEIYTKVD